MLRSLSHRPLGMLCSTRHVSRVTTRFASTSGGSKPTKEGTPSPTTTTTPSTPVSPPATPSPIEGKKTLEPTKSADQQVSAATTTTTKQPEPTPTGTTGGSNNTGGNNAGKDKPKGKYSRVVFYGGALVAAAVATEEILEHWGVFSTRDFVRTQFGIGPLRESPTASIRHPHEDTHTESPAPDPVPAVAASIATDPVLVDPTNPSSLPVEIVPLTLPLPASPSATGDDVPIEVTEVIPVEIIEIVQQDTLPGSQDSPPPTTPEQVLTELLNEISESTPPIPTIHSLPSIQSSPSTIDFHALLNAQAEQLEALREKLQQYYNESSQALDYKAQAHEAAYREALEIRERVYRKELEAKLAQLQAELQAKFESLREQERSQSMAHFQQLYEQKKAEAQRKMEEALKVAVENVQAQYSVRLAEEINKFDSKLSEVLASEDAKYTASSAARSHALDQLRAEVTQLEATLVANSAKLRESLNLHRILLFELDKLETASKTLPGGDVVVSTVAEVLRPIASEGVASYHLYNELTERFKTVLASGRQAALVPEGGGVMGNLMAAVASKLIIPAKGPVAGDTPEAIFAKAEYYLEHGELNEAVDQLSRLRGMPASIVRDWLQAASDRLVVENSLKALHAHVIVLTHQQSKDVNAA